MTPESGSFAMALTDRQTDKQTHTENKIRKLCANFFLETSFCDKNYFVLKFDKKLSTIVWKQDIFFKKNFHQTF